MLNMTIIENDNASKQIFALLWSHCLTVISIFKGTTALSGNCFLLNIFKEAVGADLDKTLIDFLYAPYVYMYSHF